MCTYKSDCVLLSWCVLFVFMSGHPYNRWFAHVERKGRSMEEGSWNTPILLPFSPKYPTGSILFVQLRFQRHQTNGRRSSLLIIVLLPCLKDGHAKYMFTCWSMHISILPFCPQAEVWAIEKRCVEYIHRYGVILMGPWLAMTRLQHNRTTALWVIPEQEGGRARCVHKHTTYQVTFLFLVLILWSLTIHLETQKTNLMAHYDRQCWSLPANTKLCSSLCEARPE